MMMVPYMFNEALMEKGRVDLRKRRLFEWMVVEIIEP